MPYLSFGFLFLGWLKHTTIPANKSRVSTVTCDTDHFSSTQKRCAFHRIQSFNTRRSHRYPSRVHPVIGVFWSLPGVSRQTSPPHASLPPPWPLAPPHHLPWPAHKKEGEEGGGGMPHGYYLCRVQVNHFPAASWTVPHREPDAMHEVPTPPPTPPPPPHGRHRFGRSEMSGSAAALEWRNKHLSPLRQTHAPRDMKIFGCLLGKTTGDGHLCPGFWPQLW